MTSDVLWPRCELESGRSDFAALDYYGTVMCFRFLFGILEEVLLGSVWRVVSPLLNLDEVVKLRTATRCWDAGFIY